MDESNIQNYSFDLVSILKSTDIFGLSVISTLFAMSLLSWAFIVYKFISLRQNDKSSKKFITLFWRTKNLTDIYSALEGLKYSPAKNIFHAGYNEMILVIKSLEKSLLEKVPFDTVKRTLSMQKIKEESFLSKGMIILAISASSSPFIGLLGTVVGIIKSFRDIGISGASNLSSVAPGISEALIATALGLFVAIPALIFYNILNNKIKTHMIALDGFAIDILNIIERHYNIERAVQK